MKYFAYFLPGFHEDNLNNQWWGEGFTEWDNLKSCSPLYTGHIPNTPPKDGYYDLSDPKTLSNQIRKIKSSGLDGITIYDYWSEGKRPLGKFIDLFLENNSLDIEFSVCWGNHAWTRSWRNKSGSLDVLLDQKYSLNDEKQFNHYCKIFSDDRYLKVDGSLFFQIYKPEDIPNVDIFVKNLRAFVLSKTGDLLHISAVVKSPFISNEFLGCFDSVTIGNPTACMFSPNNLFQEIQVKNVLSDPLQYIRSAPMWLKKIAYKFVDLIPKKPSFFEYSDLNNKLLEQLRLANASLTKPIFPSVFVGFDNTPRYKKSAKIVKNVDFLSFHRSLVDVQAVTNQNDLVFINAWNEWGEGMALEKMVDYDPNFTSLKPN